MTREETIKVLLNEWKCIDRNDGINCDRQCEKCDLVMDSAILKEAYNTAIKALEQEPCDDVVRREDAIHAFDYLMGLNRAQIQDILFKLPSVRPQEPKTGHWILDETDNSITCDKCGCLIWANDISNGEAYYCPNCGARMVEPQESEE